MTHEIGHEAMIPNPALEAFGILVGEWRTTGTHAFIPDTGLHGRASFSWIEGGAFLLMRTEVDEPQIPSAVAVFGSSNASGDFFMLYFDERGVSRKFDVPMRNGVLTYSRNEPDFAQRFTGTLSEDGDIMFGVSELCRDGVTWQRDAETTFVRVK
jgi:hypothetical protein